MRGKRVAFTLAEVLITLGIIGVVAAMTMPVLMAQHRKQVIETKLKKFYTVLNQAVKLSEVENGDKSEWSYSGASDYYTKYLSKYLNSTKVEQHDLSTIIYFSDGTALNIYSVDNSIATGFVHGTFYLNAKNVGKEGNILGKDTFIFAYDPNANKTAEGCTSASIMHANKGWEPYIWWENRRWDNSKQCGEPIIPDNNEEFINSLINSGNYGCAKNGMYCTKLIQMNNWKIPKNYPIKL